MKKYFPIVNSGISCGNSPKCWDGLTFDTFEECREWIDKNHEHFSEDEISGGVYPHQCYKVYQPTLYTDDGTNIDYDCITPSFQAFDSHDECMEYLRENDYEVTDVIINEYDAEDIEDVRIINSNGDVDLVTTIKVFAWCHGYDSFTIPDNCQGDGWDGSLYEKGAYCYGNNHFEGEFFNYEDMDEELINTILDESEFEE